MPTTQQRDADFLKDLNLIPHPRDEQKTESEAFDSADIALFADTDFFDFPDIGTVFQASKEDQLDPVSYSPLALSIPGRIGAGKPQHPAAVAAAAAAAAANNRDFGMYHSHTISPTSPSTDHHPLDSAYPSLDLQQQLGSPSSNESFGSPPAAGSSPRNVYMSSEARQAADEDKRRRNTAASARFRIKKKQREQAVERTAREMSEKVGELEKKISQLEMENRWLKNLLVEKNTINSSPPTSTDTNSSASSSGKSKV